jgi:tetratricopeptide (TPR) repeat protein
MQGNEPWSATSRTTGNELYYEFSDRVELQSLLANIEIKSTLAKPQNLPLVGELFKGRDEFLEQLRSVLTHKPTHLAAITAKQAIHGLGGVGKTRVAVEYARRYSHDYTALLFITADSPGSLQTSLANLCGALVLNLPERDAREQEVQVAAALRWLREHSGWFLIIDNVDSTEAAEAVEKLLQQLHTGHTVVTSRLSQWGDAVESLSLDVINEAAAIEFLMERTQGKRKPTATDSEDAKRLASDLGCLPLALEQAGAFVAKHRGSLQEYRARWKQQEQKVIEWHDQRSMKYPASVATTWQTSFDQLTADGRGLLNVLCWLAPDPIPLAMIQKLTSVGEELPIDVESGIADLAEYSLLKWTSVEYDFVQVHQLVQEITRYRLPETESTQWQHRAMRMANDFATDGAAPDDIQSWPTIYGPGEKHFALLVQHAEPVVNKGRQTGSRQSDLSALTTRLMNELTLYLFARASLEEAEPLMLRGLDIVEKSYGTEHPFVAIRLNNLAGLLLATDRLGEAEPLIRRALAIDEQSYGAEHPNVARDLNNLAHLLVATNRLGEAEPLMWRALDIDEKFYGPEHPNVATNLNNLANLLLATNRLGEAEPFMLRALDIDEKSYGPEHPAVARDLNNLAQLRKATNRLGEAEPLMWRALAIDEKSYGPEHPNVAIHLNNLAQLLKATNRLGKAEPLMRRSITIMAAFQHATGHEHTSLRVVRANYLDLLAAMGLSPEEANSKIEGILRGDG